MGRGRKEARVMAEWHIEALPPAAVSSEKKNLSSSSSSAASKVCGRVKMPNLCGL